MWSRSKYGNIKVQYNGQFYDSKKEAEWAIFLDQQMKKGKITSWSRQQKFELQAYDTKICDIIVDFIIKHNDGSTELMEVKSPATKTPTWRVKWKMLAAKMSKEKPFAQLTVVE